MVTLRFYLTTLSQITEYRIGLTSSNSFCLFNLSSSNFNLLQNFFSHLFSFSHMFIQFVFFFFPALRFQSPLLPFWLNSNFLFGRQVPHLISSVQLNVSLKGPSAHSTNISLPDPQRNLSLWAKRSIDPLEQKRTSVAQST
jgi:hypothetical protein